MKRFLLLILVLAASASGAVASDHMNLEENLPTELEDAYPIKFRSREFQGVIRYTDEGDEKSRMLYQPIFEFGILPNTQLNVSGTFYSGNVDREGSGDVSSELLYNFNTESIWFPATSVAVKGVFPAGEDSHGVDVTTKLILSKMPFVRTTFLHRVHANLIWTHNGGRERGKERSDLFKGIFGVSMRAGKDTSFVVDYVREQKKEKRRDANLVEAGFRRQLTPFTLVTAGAGAGIGDDSENYRVTLGFQHSF